MYTDEQIREMFKNKYNTIDPQCKEYFDAYVNIYKQSFINPCKSDRFNHHHFYCSFLYKWDEPTIEKKNRYHTIEKLDESYKPSDNICKLRILYHILAHYYLALALKGTVYEFDANNAFYTLVGDYSKNINDYTLDEVKELGRLIEENSQPNAVDRYLTVMERKEYGRKIFNEIKEKHEQDNKEKIKQKKLENKQRQKESREKWKKEHKDEIEERKRKQREYAKKMREKYRKK